MNDMRCIDNKIVFMRKKVLVLSIHPDAEEQLYTFIRINLQLQIIPGFLTAVARLHHAEPGECTSLLHHALTNGQNFVSVRRIY